VDGDAEAGFLGALERCPVFLENLFEGVRE